MTELFHRLDIRIGQILEAKVHPDADSLYVEKIDVGEDEARTIISGLRKHLEIKDLLGKKVVVLCNLKPRKMRGILSHGMLLCASTEDHTQVELLEPCDDCEIGERVVFDGFASENASEPDAKLNPKKKIWEKCAPSFATNKSRVAQFEKQNLQTLHNKSKIKCATLENAQIG